MKYTVFSDSVLAGYVIGFTSQGDQIETVVIII